MSESPAAHPLTNDHETWQAFWKTQGTPWRTEPEIDLARQQELAQRRATIVPDIAHGTYPLGNVQLSRADMEWLLATHEDGGIVGPVIWNDPAHRFRQGIDIRGANLQGVDLRYLPLTGLVGGLFGDEFRRATLHQLMIAAVNLQQAQLVGAHLEGGMLAFAHLEGANLQAAHLESADLYRAHFEHVEPANFRRATFDSNSVLNHISLANHAGVGPFLGDIRWNGAIVSAIDWKSIKMIGKEQAIFMDSGGKEWDEHTSKYDSAVRAYRQLATALRPQGFNEAADGFSYKAQLLARQGLLQQKSYLNWLGSFILDLISGYGYRPTRSFITYLSVILCFAVLYFIIGAHVPPKLNPVDALIFSITSFHGRGFTPGEAVTLHHPLTIAAAVEAIIGLVIEITFIATFTQRFFSR